MGPHTRPVPMHSRRSFPFCLFIESLVLCCILHKANDLESRTRPGNAVIRLPSWDWVMWKGCSTKAKFIVENQRPRLSPICLTLSANCLPFTFEMQLSTLLKLYKVSSASPGDWSLALSVKRSFQDSFRTLQEHHKREPTRVLTDAHSVGISCLARRADKWFWGRGWPQECRMTFGSASSDWCDSSPTLERFLGRFEVGYLGMHGLSQQLCQTTSSWTCPCNLKHRFPNFKLSRMNHGLPAPVHFDHGVLLENPHEYILR